MAFPHEEEVLNLIALARAYIVDHTKEPCAPYAAQTVLNLTPVPYVGLKGPMGVTESMVMYVDTVWVMEDPWLSQKPIMAGCIMHETEHVLCGMDRLRALPNGVLANIAGDLAINCRLRREGWLLPPWVQYPEKHELPEFLTLEQYYHLLSDRCQQNFNSSIQQMMDAAEGNPSRGQGSKSKGSGKGSSTEDKSSGSETWQPNIGSGACGSIAGNTLDPQVEEEFNREHGRSEVEAEAIRRGTLEDIEDYMVQHGRGSVPGHYQELIRTKIKPPDINWKTTLRKVIRRSMGMLRFGQRDYSMSRPSMSSPFLGVVLPSLIDRDIEIAIIRDTSGSMGNPQLEQVNNETIHAVKKAGVQSFWLIDADVTVHQCLRVKARDVPKIPMKGRGGTDFCMALEVASKLRPTPGVIIYMTDGDGVAPVKPPAGIKVVWCIVRTPHARKPANWGTTVICDKNQAMLPPCR